MKVKGNAGEHLTTLPPYEMCIRDRAYAHTTAAALRAKDCMMTKVTAVREGADDIYAEAKAINERRAEAEAAAVVEDASAEESKAE